MAGNLFNLKRYFKKGDATQKPVVHTPIASPPPPPPPNQQPATTKQSVVSTQSTSPAQPASPSSPPEPVAQTTAIQSPVEPLPQSPQGFPASSAPAPGVPPAQEGQVAAPPAQQSQPPAEPPSEEVEEMAEEGATQLQKRARMDVLTRLTQRSNQAILKAAGKAKQLGSHYIDTEHVLWGLLTDAGIYQLLTKLEVTPKEVQDGLEQNLAAGDFTGQPQFSPRVKRSLELALSAARSLGYEFISPEHILLALAQEGEGLAAKTLAQFDITVEKINKVLGTKPKEAKEEEVGAMAATASPLEQFTHDLTALARAGKLDPVVARSAEIERVIHILSRRTKNNPVLIGDAGVGKTAIAEGLAQKIATGDVPEPLLKKHILSLDLMSLVAGTKHRGEFEERLKGLLGEVEAAQGNIILFIDEIQNLVGAGAGSGTMDAANILKPTLARGELQAIGTTTITEYRKHIEKDPALERRFQPVMINEPTPDQAIEMLRALRDKYEAFHKVSISDEALEAAVRLSQRYIGDRFLPDKAVDLIDEAASAVRLPAISLPEEIKSLQDKQARLTNEKAEAENLNDTVRIATIGRELQTLQAKLEDLMERYNKKKSTTTTTVTPQIIEEIVSGWTGIPVARLTEKESDKLLKLEDFLHQRLIDQDAAVQVVAEAVRRGRAGLKSTKRPIGSFIFMGPTGVGKTELAKALAEILFGSEELMVRLDMSEFMEKHEVAKLIGAPPGYVGYEEGGQLTEAVRRKPYSVILLDEIEKAHPDVFNILIQLLDDGRLTDSKGRTISFKNTIVICTSNIGTGLIQREMLEITPTIQETVVFDTYAVSPVGMEMITLKDRYWINLPEKSVPKKGQKEKKRPSLELKGWTTAELREFFAGHQVTNADPAEPSHQLPEEGFNTHTIYPSGEEWITAGGRYWVRTSQVVKEWTTGSLIEFFAGHEVINATVDNPSEQLPTARLSTNAVTPEEAQTVTFNNRYWTRQSPHDTSWETGLLSDRAQEETQIPTDKWDNHLFLNDGSELIIVGDQYWKRKSEQEVVWQTGNLASLFTSQVVENASPEDPSQQLPLGQKVSEEKEKKVLESEGKFAEMAEKLIEELRKFFRPELLNRFDEILVFQPLTVEHMLAIVGLQLETLTKLLEEQGIGLETSGATGEQLTAIGYDPLYGARPLRRAIQRELENPISSQIIKGELVPGDILAVDFDGNEFTFQVKKPARAAESAPSPPPIETPPEDQSPSPPTEVKCQDCGYLSPGSPGTVCPACGSTTTTSVSEPSPTQPPEETPPAPESDTPPPSTTDLQADLDKLVSQAPEETGTPVQETQEAGDPGDTPPASASPLNRLAQYYQPSAPSSSSNTAEVPSPEQGLSISPANKVD